MVRDFGTADPKTNMPLEWPVARSVAQLARRHRRFSAREIELGTKDFSRAKRKERSMKRLRWSRQLHAIGLLSISVLLATVLSSCASSTDDNGAGSGGKGQKLTLYVGTQPETMDYFSLWLAYHGGYFADQGLDVSIEHLKNGNLAMSTLLGGQAQIVISSPPSLVAAAAKGQKVVAVAPICQGLPFHIYINKATAEAHNLTPDMPLEARIAGLKGLKLGTSGPGSGFDVMTRYLLKQYAGLDPDKDVSIQSLGGETTVPALVNGQIDAAMMNTPNGPTAVDSGKVISLIDLHKEVPVFGTQLCEAVMTTESYLAGNEEILTKVIAGLQAANKVLQSDPEAAKKVLRSRYPKLSGEVFEESYEIATQATPTSMIISEDAMQSVIDSTEQASGETLNVKAADLIDVTIAQKVQRSN